MIRRLVLVTALAGWLLIPHPAGAHAPADPLQAALDWLRTQQQADGGFSNGFVPGSDPGATADAVLAIVAGEAGLDAAAAQSYLDSDEGVDAIALMDGRAREIGVQGVPFFIFNQHIAVSGAQEPDVLLDAIAQARAV
jgi:predicted DsbA family dithiol-disulfide isomerase